VQARIEHDPAGEDQLVLSVADDGPGLAPGLVDEHHRPRLGMTTKPEGHGLGLRLCHEIAQSLGGHLSLTSRQPRGTVLTLTCPTSFDPERQGDDGGGGA
jgi:C4-dicarboxylate-specific signal transduction histidine kinase